MERARMLAIAQQNERTAREGAELARLAGMTPPDSSASTTHVIDAAANRIPRSTTTIFGDDVLTHVAPNLDNLPEALRPESRHGSTELSSRALDGLPPLRRMGNRSIRDGRLVIDSIGTPNDLTLPTPLRNEWRPASEFNNGLGDRERSWSPDVHTNDTEDDHWETHLTTISPEILDTTRSAPVEELPHDPVYPILDALQLIPISTSNPNVFCDDDTDDDGDDYRDEEFEDDDSEDSDDATEADNLESIVQRYSGARTESNVESELRTTRDLAEDVRAMLERFLLRRSRDMDVRELDQMRDFLARISQFGVELDLLTEPAA